MQKSRSLAYLLLLVLCVKLWIVDFPNAPFYDLRVYFEAGRKAVLSQTVYDGGGCILPGLI
jgi:hypothetical protein